MLVLAWHTSPLWLWHWRLENELRADGDPSRMQVERWDIRPSDAGERWDELVAGEIVLRAPLTERARSECEACSQRCRLDLAERGSLAIFRERPPGDYSDILHAYAPDIRDLSLWRSVVANWKTIDAVTDRVRLPATGIGVVRFDAPHSRGVVSLLNVKGHRRYVIYAFSKDSNAGQILAVAGLDHEAVKDLLRGLRIETEHSDRPTGCNRASP